MAVLFASSSVRLAHVEIVGSLPAAHEPWGQTVDTNKVGVVFGEDRRPDRSIGTAF